MGRLTLALGSVLLFSLASLHQPASAAVGTTKMQTRVTSSGAAQVSIPITVPPARGGFRPSISLEYNSQSGNGLLGVGWNISGLSKVSRCATTLDSDGYVSGVKYNEQTRDKQAYCLDGARIFLKESASTGDSYVVEDNPALKVSALGKELFCQQGYQQFEVRGKGGIKRTYAAHVFQYLQPGNYSWPYKECKHADWLLSTEETTDGEQIAYEYAYEGNQEAAGTSSGGILGTVTNWRISYAAARLHEVKYGKDVKGGYLNSIKFVYSDSSVRQDTESAYINQLLFPMLVRLDKVQVYRGEKLVREYVLSYEYGKTTKRSRLIGLLEKAWNDKVQAWELLPESKFAYSESSFEHKVYTGSENGVPVNFTFESNGVTYDAGTRSAELNGDGVPDWVNCTWLVADQKTHLNVYVSSVAGYQKNPGNYVASMGDVCNVAIGYYDRLLQGLYTYDLGVRYADVNGDGYDDIIQLFPGVDGQHGSTAYSGAARRRVLLNNGNGGFAESASYSTSLGNLAFSSFNAGDLGTRLADLDGDGLLDLIQLYRPPASVCSSGCTRYYSASQKHIYLNDGSKFVRDDAWSASLPEVYFTGDTIPGYVFSDDLGGDVLDVNGDGLPDLISLTESSGLDTSIYINTGSGFLYDAKYTDSIKPEKLVLKTVARMKRGVRLADLNGDGLVDVIKLFGASLEVREANQSMVWINTGEKFISSPSWVAQVADANIWLSMDNPYGVYFDVVDGSSDGGGQRYFGTELADVNSDGRMDLVQLIDFGLKELKLWDGVEHYVDGCESEPSACTSRRIFLNNGKALKMEPSSDVWKRLPAIYLDQLRDGDWQPIWSGPILDLGARLLDFNGDGGIDYVQHHCSSSGTCVRQGVQFATGKPDLLQSVTNGLGVVTSLTYQPMTAGSIYKNEEKSAYPNRDFANSMHLVDTLTTDDGAGGTRKVEYRYGDAVFQQRGRNFQGFRWIESRDHMKNELVRTEYEQRFPFTGNAMLEQVQSCDAAFTDASCQLMKERRTQWEASTQVVGGHTVYLPYVKHTEAREWDVSR